MKKVNVKTVKVIKNKRSLRNWYRKKETKKIQKLNVRVSWNRTRHLAKAKEIYMLSHVWLFAIPWTIKSMEFSRPEYFPFSRGSSQPRNQSQVSCIAGRRFTFWATGKPKCTIKCDVLKPSRNLPSPGPGKNLSSTELVPGAKKFGGCWARIFQLRHPYRFFRSRVSTFSVLSWYSFIYLF